MRILVTGGGTSGHISPALAIIQTIQNLAAKEEFAVEFLYLGSRNGPERELVAKAGIPFVGIQTGKLRRYFSFENFVDQGRLPIGLMQSLRAIRAFKPDVVFSTGGYVAVPPVVAASLLNRPILIHEQTVQIGLANRITSRFATRIALSFESALSELAPRQQKKTFVTGNPIRPQIFDGDRREGKHICGFDAEDDELPTLYVTGGSQGARVINRAVEAALPELLQFCRIVHQCGHQPDGEEQDFDRLRRAIQVLEPRLKRRIFVQPFFHQELRHVLALADLVLGRAGAGTVAELCALGKPAIYIPLVPTGGDEQTRNAQMCVRAGAAVIVRQSELDGARLLAELQPLIGDAARLREMGQAASTLARPNAADELARAVLQLAAPST